MPRSTTIRRAANLGPPMDGPGARRRRRLASTQDGLRARAGHLRRETQPCDAAAACSEHGWEHEHEGELHQPVISKTTLTVQLCIFLMVEVVYRSETRNLQVFFWKTRIFTAKVAYRSKTRKPTAQNLGASVLSANRICEYNRKSIWLIFFLPASHPFLPSFFPPQLHPFHGRRAPELSKALLVALTDSNRNKRGAL